ncbi:adenylate kinase [Treponema sp. OMZ 305]|uniref:adenylate kinase n=1 Tax=Treponema sp. OMZ 305 TaxID=1659192 RepID=UPI0020A26B74|nr:adenylate kinase [Treponema sp. OMZ 305]UTC58332.1 adenylate kinase [Treponema sp. OMZ 305]
MKLVFLGPPGAGKGTLASEAAKYYGIPHISTGSMFRTAIKEHTSLGQKIQKIIDSGSLVDDETTAALVKERLAQPDAQNGFILDGFPRTIAQAEILEVFCSLDAVINFDISDKAVIKRLSGRRLCPSCGKNFHIEFMKPQVEGICDNCRGVLVIREDDKIEAIVKRLETYREQTVPLIEFYQNKKLLITLDAQPAPAVILENFINLFSGKH